MHIFGNISGNKVWSFDELSANVIIISDKKIEKHNEKDPTYHIKF